MIDARTELYGVIGNGVRESLSPVIHNGAFQRMGMNAVYLAFPVNDLRAAVAGIREFGMRGVSVTVPFKTEILPLLDALDSTAEKIKAVNTIANRHGRLIGYNTDWLGAVGALEETITLRGRKILLLGAGGAARAIAFGLKERGSEVFIYNRSPEKAQALAEESECVSLPGLSWGRVEIEVIINASSAGMRPEESATPLPKELLRPGMTVMDIVYRPRRTRLLREAEGRGCRTVDGLEMLARQGAEQVRIWTGNKPEIKAVIDDLHKALERPGDVRRKT